MVFYGKRKIKRRSFSFFRFNPNLTFMPLDDSFHNG